LLAILKNRLDIPIKARFFRHLLYGGDDDAEQVYIKHILARTGGKEPNDKKSTKVSIDDYLAQARLLLTSMQTIGFDASHPIKICTTPRLKNGAHRIACALVLDLGIVCSVSDRRGKAKPWGVEQLQAAGISGRDIARAIEEMKTLKRIIGECYAHEHEEDKEGCDCC
jgi:hypothetical protein